MSPGTVRTISALVAAASVVDLTLLKKTPTKWGPKRKVSGYIGLAGAVGLWLYANHLEKREQQVPPKQNGLGGGQPPGPSLDLPSDQTAGEVVEHYEYRGFPIDVTRRLDSKFEVDLYWPNGEHAMTFTADSVEDAEDRAKAQVDAWIEGGLG